MNEFNWEKFHKDLDRAIAIIIQESGIEDIFLPSQVTLMSFCEISNNKRKEQIKEQKDE